jgi:hypothetical protein
MGISIKGIKVSHIDISKDKETGENKVTGNYDLMSTNDVVLAKQSFNGYSDIKVDMSLETKQALNTFLNGFKKDIMIILGLTEE